MKMICYFLILTSATATWSGVNPQNGNFFISYTDLIVDGAEITRTYNSKTNDSGWFGFGWGSNFETALETSADGSIVVHEHGSGHMSRYVTGTRIDPNIASQKIIDEMIRRKDLTKKEAKALIKKLKSDSMLSHQYSQKYNVKALIAPGSEFKSVNGEDEKIFANKDGFIRTLSDGAIDTFNLEGKLIKSTDKSGGTVTLEYDKKGLLNVISTSKSGKIFFSWYPSGMVKEVWSDPKSKAEYKYKDKDLVYSKDSKGNVYDFTYDKIHSLTEIVYADKTKKKISYDPKSFFATEVSEPSGLITSYTYGEDPKAPNSKYWTIKTVKEASKKAITTRYDYTIKTGADGTKHTDVKETILP